MENFFQAQNRDKRKHDVSDDDDATDEDIPKPSLRKQSTSLSSVASKDSGKDVKPPPMKRTKCMNLFLYFK